MRQEYPTEVKKWEVFEVALEGPSEEGEPFKGVFSNKNESVVVDGFYDGEGMYKIRFMPSYEGRYTFILKGGYLESNLSGVFYVKENEDSKHGLVRVNGTKFIYEDGTPFNCFATTSNIWHLQDIETIEETISFLESSKVFNKVRFNILPYDNTYVFPYNLSSENKIESFNHKYFQKLEKAVKRLEEIDVEADLVFFTPSEYIWLDLGYSFEEAIELVAYTVNRLSAYHNVWWSLANDYDAIPLSGKDWIELANVLVNNDPYSHLRSIMNSHIIYDYKHNWPTHCSIKQVDCYKGCEETDELVARFNKPVVYEDFGFEGNLEYGWGNLTKEEALRRVWEVTLRGGYPSYSEARNINEKEWWLQGGKISSSNINSIALLKELVNDSEGLSFYPYSWDELCAIYTNEEDAEVRSQYLYYYSFMAPGKRSYFVDDETDYLVEVIDTVNANIYRQGIHRGEFEIELPEKPYVAVRLSLPNDYDYEHPFDEEEKEEVIEEEIKENEFEGEVIEIEESEEEPTLIIDDEDIFDDTFEAEEDETLYTREEELKIFEDDDIEDEIDDVVEEVIEEEAKEEENNDIEEEVIEVEEDAWEEMFANDPTEVLEVQEETELVEEDLFGSGIPKREEIITEEQTLELPLPIISEEDEEELPEIVTGAIPVIKETKKDNTEELEDLRREPMIVPNEEEPHIPSIEETLNIMFMNRNKNGGI